MSAPEIEEFARILVQRVRDAAIRSCDGELQASAESPVAKRWRDAARSNTPEEFARAAIPDIVDETVFHLLDAIDQGLLKISFTASTGGTVDLTSDGLGELSGWYAGSPGWRTMHAKERFVDDFSDLK